ncbi:MAG: hypothetical protein O2968_11420 [Acidobacteria bacterium]|nr:hypothetical protein [Acidobacteriota bacterium]
MIYLGLLLTCAIGWLLLPARWECRLPAKLSFAFAAGAFAISVEMFALDLAGLGWNPFVVLLPWLAFAGWRIYRDGISLLEPVWPWRAETPSPLSVLLVILILAPVLGWMPFERLTPLTAWDAWAIWMLKAKAFYLDGTMSGFFSRHQEFVGQPGYPLLIPLYATFLYVVNGGVADASAKILSPCFFLALLGVFHHFARRWAPPIAALVFTAMLASIPMVDHLGFELAGYAGTALSLYFVAAAGFVYEWHREGRVVHLAAACLAATAAAWTKNEGQFFLAAVLVLAAFKLFRARVPALNWAWLAAPAVILGPWTLVRRSHEIEAAGFTPLIDFDPGLFGIALRRLLSMGFDTQLYNLTFLLLVAGIVGAAILRMRPRFWILPGLAAWQFAGALLAYATGRNEIQWWLGTSAGRILAQIAPLALLAPALVYSEWIARTSEGDISASAPPKKAKVDGRARRSRKKHASE